MKKFIGGAGVLLLLGWLMAARGAHAEGFDQTHSAWTSVLAAYQTDDGRVRYKQLKADVGTRSDHPLKVYLAAIEGVSKATFQSWGREDQMAFLINAYNAETVKVIIDHYPIESIKDVGSIFKSPWKKELFSLLSGEIKTLDGIEHDWLRPKFGDARVHAAVNCASISCPRLAPDAFTGATLNTRLDAMMHGWLADAKRNTYEPKTGALHLSKIFNWYGEDFVKAYGSVAKTVERFGPEAAKEALRVKGTIDFLDYDWTLNEAK